MGLDDPRGVVARIPGIDDRAKAAILGETVRSISATRPRR
jgi:hypothetical protein